MINITQHGDDELVDWYLNDEALYNFAHACGSLKLLREDAERHFIFNSDQWAALADHYTLTQRQKHS